MVFMPWAMADYTALYENFKGTHIIPVSLKSQVLQATMLATPFLPLILIEISLSALMGRLLNSLVQLLLTDASSLALSAFACTFDRVSIALASFDATATKMPIVVSAYTMVNTFDKVVVGVKSP